MMGGRRTLRAGASLRVMRVPGALLSGALLTGALLTGCGAKEADAGKDGGGTVAAAADPSVLVIPRALRGRLDLTIVPAEEREIRRTVTVPAVVISDPAMTAHVSPLIDGRLASVTGWQGQHVTKGMVLATLESMELGEMTAEHIRMQSESTTATAEYERIKGLHDGQVTSDRQMQAARNAMIGAKAAADAARTKLLAAGLSDDDIAALGRGGAPLLRLRAPISGVVSVRNAALGQHATRGDKLFEIIATGTVTVEGNVFEGDIASLRAGQSAVFTTNAWPGAEFTGKLSAIGPTLDEKTNALPVYCTVSNPAAKLRPNQHGRLAIRTEVPVRVVSIPLDAVAYDGNDTYVFIPSSDSTFIYRKVETGMEFDDRVEIRNGLRKDDRVVSRGVFQLKSQLKLAGEE